MEQWFRVERKIAALFRQDPYSRCATASEIARPSMRSQSRRSLIAFFTILLALPAGAQDISRPSQPTPNAATLPATLTGKERLGPKWNDEQRIDNCKVPIDKRGAKPRSSTCPIPMG